MTDHDGFLSPARYQAPTAQRVVEAFLGQQAESTRKAYAAELRRMARWAACKDAGELAAQLFGHGRGHAQDVVLRWREHLQGRSLAPATINRSLAAVKSMADVAEALGLVEWSLKIKGVKQDRVVDLAGPGPDELRAILAAASTAAAIEEQEDGPVSWRATRDLAILHLLLRGLRRVEIVELDMEHFDPLGGVLMVRRKGKTIRRPVDLAPEQTQALKAWIAARGPAEGPLFLGLEGPKRGKRLNPSSLWHATRRLARQAGLEPGPRYRPHAFRHAAVTIVIEAGGGLEAAQSLAEHTNPATTKVYDDASRRRAKKAASMIYTALGRQEDA